jgi:gamma-glutamyltranspeptidase / glutathione hydrolase
VPQAFNLRRPVRRALAALFVIVLVWGPAAQASKEAIASAHPLATAAGQEVLAQGGNAFDAAVAVAAALAVVEPFSSGLGGGGFFLLHRAADGFETMIDARETAPGRSSPHTYVDADGNVTGRLSLDGALAAGIPGTPAGLAWLAGHYGNLPLATSLGPAMRLALDGFPVDARYVHAARFRAALLKADPATARVFLADGEVPAPGYVVRQPELAQTLAALAAKGRDGYYAGDVARRLVAGVQMAGGIWELDDLAGYRIVERSPTRISYRGAQITCASLPSSGGLVLTEALQILERYPLATLPRPQRDHFVIEALRRGYQDRARYMGDPDFVTPPAVLATRAYADERAASIKPDKATPSAELDRLYPVLPEGDNTTHFSVVDAQGNRVAATLSVNLPFGAGLVAGDTGVLLNDEMNDFSVGGMQASAYRLAGGAANAVAPGKRPLSSMTPTFLEDDRGVLVFGTPGGSRIISMVLLGILEYVDSPVLDLERVVGAPRFHHQYLPDRVQFETPPYAMPEEWVEALRAMGHTVEQGSRAWGNMQAVFVDKHSGGAASAYNDPRGKAGMLF